MAPFLPLDGERGAPGAGLIAARGERGKGRPLLCLAQLLFDRGRNRIVGGQIRGVAVCDDLPAVRLAQVVDEHAAVLLSLLECRIRGDDAVRHTTRIAGAAAASKRACVVGGRSWRM